jgi:hypothetical protein
MRVKLLLASVALLVIVVPSTSAQAASPSRGCPPSFIGPLTFEELIERWPPPPELPDPEGVLMSFDHNGDRMLCVMESVPQNPMGPINVIDNNAAT